MAPLPTNNSPNNDANRNKRRRNKNKRQKKQQQQKQQQQNSQQATKNTTYVQIDHHDRDVQKDDEYPNDVVNNTDAVVGVDVNNDNNQQDDCSLAEDEVTTSQEDSSNLEAVNNDDSQASDNTNNHSIVIDSNNQNDGDSSHAGDNDKLEDDEPTDNVVQNQHECPKLDSITSASVDQIEDSTLEATNQNMNISNNNLNINNETYNISTEVQDASIDVNTGDVLGDTPRRETNPEKELENAERKKLLRAKLREYRKLRARFESQSTQMADLTDHVRQQANKITDLESLVLNSKKTCNKLEKLLQQEVACRTKLEQEKTTLCQTVNRLKTQISIFEKNKLTNDELMRTINATLMERDTEVSMLKLKLTRLQTNQSLTMASNGLPSIEESSNNDNRNKDNLMNNNNDRHRAFIAAGRSNSEFNRNSALRSTMIADGATHSSTSQLRSIDDDSSVWASIPADLTPSRRPQLLEKSFQAIYNESKHNQQFNSNNNNNNTSTPLARDKRYKTLPPRSIIKSSDRNRTNGANNEICDITMKSNNNIDPTNLPKSCTKVASTSTACNNLTNTNTNTKCQVTNLDDSNTSGNKSSSTTNSGDPNHTLQANITSENGVKLEEGGGVSDITAGFGNYNKQQQLCNTMGLPIPPPMITANTVTTSSTLIQDLPGPNNNNNSNAKTQMIMPPLSPSKKSSGFRRIFDRFRRTDSNASKTSEIYTEHVDDNLHGTPKKSSPFKRNANRATLVGLPGDGRAQMSPKQQKISFQTDKPFAEWNTDMIVEWLTMIGLSMYANQCRRWVRCGAHIMNATPAEVDKGLGITNHLHRKKLRLAISELNGDCDKVTKAAAKLDYLWIARWLDDLGLPQYKEAFINARVDGRVLNYLTVEDLLSLGVKSVLHHSSIKCGIRVLRSTNFDLQLLKRRATSDEIDDMNRMRQQVNHVNDALSQATPISLKQAVLSAQNNNNAQQSSTSSNNNPSSNRALNADLTLWTCHRVMEWLRLIDFAEFAPNLRGSGVHGGLMVYEDGFNFDTMCCLLSIPLSRTLLRRHLSTYFDHLIGKDLVARKLQYRESSPNPLLNPFDEIKTPKKVGLWPLTKLKSSSKVGQNGTDDYLVPMYPMEPQLIKRTTAKSHTSPTEQPQQSQHQHPTQQLNLKNDISIHSTPLAQIPESVNV